MNANNVNHKNLVNADEKSLLEIFQWEYPVQYVILDQMNETEGLLDPKSQQTATDIFILATTKNFAMNKVKEA